MSKMSRFSVGELSRGILNHLLITPMDNNRTVSMLEQLTHSMSLRDVYDLIGRHQPALWLFINVLLGVAAFVGVIALAVAIGRHGGRHCGAERSQDITPQYITRYRLTVAALCILMILMFVFTVQLHHTTTKLDKSTKLARDFYTNQGKRVEAFAQQTVGDNVVTEHNLAKSQEILNKMSNINLWKKAFVEFVDNKFENNTKCGQVVKTFSNQKPINKCQIMIALQHRIAEETAENLSSSSDLLRARQRMHEKIDELRVRRNRAEETFIRTMSQTKLKFKKLDAAIEYSRFFGTIIPSFLWILPKFLALSLLAAIIALALGVTNHDMGMMPTLRNAKSNIAGLIFVYIPAMWCFTTITILPIAAVILIASSIGETSMCEPYYGGNHRAFDAIATQLLHINSIDVQLRPSVVLNKCANHTALKEKHIYRKNNTIAKSVVILKKISERFKRAFKRLSRELMNETKIIFAQKHQEKLPQRKILWMKGLNDINLLSAKTINMSEVEKSFNDTLELENIYKDTNASEASLGDVFRVLHKIFFEHTLAEAKAALGNTDYNNKAKDAQNYKMLCSTPMYAFYVNGAEKLCNGYMSNINGTWFLLVCIACVCLAAIPVSLKLSKYYLLMDSYRYINWDRIRRHYPKRPKQERTTSVLWNENDFVKPSVVTFKDVACGGDSPQVKTDAPEKDHLVSISEPYPPSTPSWNTVSKVKHWSNNDLLSFYPPPELLNNSQVSLLGASSDHTGSQMSLDERYGNI